MHLTLIGGDTIYYGSRQYVAATTFEQGEQILRAFKQAGVEGIRLFWHNWQHKGSLAPGLELEPEGKLGGMAGLKAVIATAHELGYQAILQAELVQMDSDGSKLSPKSYGVRSVEGDTLFNYELFYLNPQLAYHYAQQLVDGAEALGADGIYYSGFGETIFRDYNPQFNYTRNDTAYIYNRILEQTREGLGASGTNMGNAYALRYLDDILFFQSDSYQFYAIDETVPFYPIALHGHLAYSMAPGNLRSQYQTEFLRAVEYGAVPAFTLTAESSRTLMNTKTFGIFTSQFSQWKDQAVEEYEAFNQLAAVHHLPIEGHYQREPGVYCTVYADGTTVVVDYNKQAFHVEKGGGA